jgi:hypothetical protein
MTYIEAAYQGRLLLIEAERGRYSGPRVSSAPSAGPSELFKSLKAMALRNKVKKHDR